MAQKVRTETGHNVLERYGAGLREALAVVGLSRPPSAGFEPEFALPEMSDALVEYFAVADLRFAGLGRIGRTSLALLDLMGNPGTRTVKTLASLVIVARAVRHTDTTGEPVLILTPSSANKATALRDAVLRAYRTGLSDPHRLRIVTLVPDASRPKLWSSALSEDPELAARNPMCVLDPDHPEHVKSVVTRTLADCAGELRQRTGMRLWHTLDLANYRCADTVRAMIERDELPQLPGRTRAHVHAVSSAFGLLGHHFGTTLLPESAAAAQYFLVQHLATPDMVQSLYGTTTPEYTFDPTTMLYHQDADPHYPTATFDPAENMESTFYTRSPATSPAMNEIIGRQGGGGIVVSRHECLARYEEIRALLDNADVRLPSDPAQLREWSLVMAMTGTLNAMERGLLSADEVIVHGSGSYSTHDFTPIPAEALRRVGGPVDLGRVVLDAASDLALDRAA